MARAAGGALAGQMEAQAGLFAFRSSALRTVTAKSFASTAPDRTAPSGIVPEAELQQVGDAPYFQDTIKLDRGRNLRLAGRSQRGERRPRDAACADACGSRTPAAPDGKPFGIVIINVDMRPALDRVRSSVRQGENIYVGRRPAATISFTPTGRANSARNLGSRPIGEATFPIWRRRLGTTPSISHIAPDQTGRPAALALAPPLLAGSEWVGVIETVPNAVIMGPATAIRNSSLLVGLIAVLCARRWPS